MSGLVAFAPGALGCAHTMEAPSMRRAIESPPVYADVASFGVEPAECPFG